MGSAAAAAAGEQSDGRLKVGYDDDIKGYVGIKVCQEYGID